MQQKNKILSLDSRPSDAIILALKSKSKIYVKSSLFNSANRIC
ncbi:MAG: bifunctional nuclease domain-containing protein [Candidatus Njordarchaeota archaeon]